MRRENRKSIDLAVGKRNSSYDRWERIALMLSECSSLFLLGPGLASPDSSFVNKRKNIGTRVLFFQFTEIKLENRRRPSFWSQTNRSKCFTSILYCVMLIRRRANAFCRKKCLRIVARHELTMPCSRSSQGLVPPWCFWTWNFVFPQFFLEHCIFSSGFLLHGLLN